MTLSLRKSRVRSVALGDTTALTEGDLTLDAQAIMHQAIGCRADDRVSAH